MRGGQRDQPRAAEEPSAHHVRRPVLPYVHSRKPDHHDEQRRSRQHGDEDGTRRRPDQLAVRAQDHGREEHGAARETVAIRRLVDAYQLHRRPWTCRE